jgi:hypothetical protein
MISHHGSTSLNDKPEAARSITLKDKPDALHPEIKRRGF